MDEPSTVCDSQIRKGTVGMRLSEGEIVLTASGRRTSPFPRLVFGSARKATNTIKRVERWLMQNAVDEAKSRNDRRNAVVFESGANSPTTADKDCAEEYLFGTSA